MQAEDLIDLINKIKHYQCEFQTIEVKSAQNGCPTRIYDTLSGFSNQDEGGIIIFGLDEHENFKTVGVYDAQDLQKKITEQCKQMSPVVRPLFTIAEADGKIIVSAEIPGANIDDRPVFYSGVGRIKGSYTRVGDSDEHMSEYEIYSFEAFRKRIRDDVRQVPIENRKLWNKERLDSYLNSVKKDRPNLSSNLTDSDILNLLGITNDGKSTLAGELCFSNYPQGNYPQLCITAVSIPGIQMGETGSQNERFLDNLRITGSISEMLDSALDFVRRNCKMRTIIDDNGKRTDLEEYPLKAVREVILNALVHRDYSIHSENTPIRIELYLDRLEVYSIGGLYGHISIDELGKGCPETRNAALANILEILRVTENRYSGIPTIQAEMKKYRLPPAEFEIKHGIFKVTLRNTPVEENVLNNRDYMDINASDIDRALLEFCKIPRSRAELCQFTGYSRYYTMSSIIMPLVKKGLLKMTLPEKPKSSKQKFYACH